MPDPSAPVPYQLHNGRVELLAVDHGRNIARRYSVDLSEDLFGVHVLETAWGSVGGWTVAKRVSFIDRDDAERMVAYHFRRRASAERRIGIAYRPVADSL